MYPKKTIFKVPNRLISLKTIDFKRRSTQFWTRLRGLDTIGSRKQKQGIRYATTLRRRKWMMDHLALWIVNQHEGIFPHYNTHMGTASHITGLTGTSNRHGGLTKGTHSFETQYRRNLTSGETTWHTIKNPQYGRGGRSTDLWLLYDLLRSL